MNTIKKILVASSLVLSLSAACNSTVAAVIQTGMEQPINNTLKHLEAALGAVDANDLETAQEHIKAARQASKEIIGGSLEAKTQRGSDAIVNARLHAKEGNTAGAAASLKEAIGVFKSMLRPFEVGSQGGLK
jgi:hypothetical protein